MMKRKTDDKDHTRPPPEESRNQMSGLPDIAGTAALAICESLLLALNDHKILPEREIMGVLKDAAATKGGFWTPASAMGHALIARLQSHAGLTFSVE